MATSVARRIETRARRAENNDWLERAGRHPQKVVGVDGALKRLAGEPYGPLLLGVVALGLLAFGLFSFVEARFRKVLED